MFSSIDRVMAALARIHEVEEARGGLQAGIPPITVAISREAGSRGALIARAVGERLNWPVYDNELLTRIAEEKGLHHRLLEQLDEQRINWLQECVQKFCSVPTLEIEVYLRHLLELLASLAEKGHCVIVGRGAAQILPAESTLRVRIVGSRDTRIAEAQKRFNYTPAEAERWLSRIDKDRHRFVKDYFHIDPSDMTRYDLTLNSDRFNDSECADLILTALKAMEARPRPQHKAKVAV